VHDYVLSLRRDVASVMAIGQGADAERSAEVNVSVWEFGVIVGVVLVFAARVARAA
jgi:hypothetical protein